MRNESDEKVSKPHYGTNNSGSVILAKGHSARDVYVGCWNQVEVEAKVVQSVLRLEHPSN